MFRFFKSFRQKPQVPDSTLDEWSETYERDLAYLAEQLREERSVGNLSAHQRIPTTAPKVA